jgi:hypothetical protein
MSEVKFSDQAIVLKDNLVKTNILPKVTGDLDRDITVQENVVIEGAIFARNLIVDNGPVEFQGSVYTHKELFIKNTAKGVCTFKKAVASNDTVVALLAGGNVVFASDINANVVKLKNCFVGGSIFANEIQLENAVVLGGCFAAKKLTIQNAITGTFNAPEVNAGGTNYLLYPTAFSVEPMNLLPKTEFYNLTLADLGSLFKGDPELPNTGKIRLDINADSQKTILVDVDSDTKLLMHSYSVSGRVLVADMVDFEKMENHFLLLSASLGSQILTTYPLPTADGTVSQELKVDTISAFFFNILAGVVPIREIDGTISFEELKERYS